MEATSAGAMGPRRPDLYRRRTRRSTGEAAIRLLLLAAALVSVLTTFGIVISLLEETVKFFGEVGFSDFFFGTKWLSLIHI